MSGTAIMDAYTRFSDQTINYIIGMLSSDGETILRMYASGSAMTTALKLGLTMLGSWSGIVAGNPDTVYYIVRTYLETLIPVIIQNPVLAVITFAFNVVFAAVIWGFKYEMATAGGHR